MAVSTVKGKALSLPGMARSKEGEGWVDFENRYWSRALAMGHREKKLRHSFCAAGGDTNDGNKEPRQQGQETKGREARTAKAQRDTQRNTRRDTQQTRANQHTNMRELKRVPPPKNKTGMGPTNEALDSETRRTRGAGSATALR